MNPFAGDLVGIEDARENRSSSPQSFANQYERLWQASQEHRSDGDDLAIQRYEG